MAGTKDQFRLADPDFSALDSIELLLGADVFTAIVEDGFHKRGPGFPVAQRTTLGWILSGVIDEVEHAPAALLQCRVDDELISLMKDFWEQEKLPSRPVPLTRNNTARSTSRILTHDKQMDYIRCAC